MGVSIHDSMDGPSMLREVFCKEAMNIVSTCTDNIPYIQMYHSTPTRTNHAVEDFNVQSLASPVTAQMTDPQMTHVPQMPRRFVPNLMIRGIVLRSLM